MKKCHIMKKYSFITGDLGYGLWDRIKIDYPDRFYNVMSSEQLMVGGSSRFSYGRIYTISIFNYTLLYL